MKNYILIIFFLICSAGCATSYQNYINVSLKPRDNTNTELFYLIESIAMKHGLEKDSSNSIEGKKASFWGKPYHYYIFETNDDEDEKITVNFTHEARMSGGLRSHNEPEKEFLEIIQKIFSSDIEKLDYNFKE